MGLVFEEPPSRRTKWVRRLEDLRDHHLGVWVNATESYNLSRRCVASTGSLVQQAANREGIVVDIYRYHSGHEDATLYIRVIPPGEPLFLVERPKP